MLSCRREAEGMSPPTLKRIPKALSHPIQVVHVCNKMQKFTYLIRGGVCVGLLDASTPLT
jgi:hypothetical protein